MKTFKGYFAKDALWIKLLLVLFFLLIGMVVGSALSLPINTGNEVRDILYGQFVASIFTFVVSALLIAYLVKNDDENFFQDNRFPSFSMLIYGVCFLIFLMPLVELTTFWNEKLVLPDFLHKLETTIRSLEDEAMEITAMIINRKGEYALLSNVFFLALVPAISEEIFFRGTLQQIFHKHCSPGVSIWVTAIIFSAFHFQFYGFVPRVLLGAMLGYLFYYGRSIYLSILIHFCNNAMAVIVGSIIGFDSTTQQMPGIDTTALYSSVLFSFPIVIVIFLAMRREFRLREKNDEN